MEKPLLQAIVRDVASKTASSVRSEGEIPAVLYGHNISNIHLTVKLGEFEKLFRKAGESTIVELKTVDGKTHNVLVQDVQRHYLTGAPIHIDFLEVSMTEKLTATVPLEFVGESIAVKNMGGTLVKVLDEVEVECLPNDLPHNIEIDISVLKTFEDQIQIKDLKVPSGVQINAEPEETVIIEEDPAVEEENTSVIIEESVTPEPAVSEE
jgi:large subunit ribosomal protein L25